MAHEHPVYDTDPYFSIDSQSRAVTCLSDNPPTLVQYDHNSERFTFEAPRYIEEHDMSLCNQVRVHYINIGEGGRKSNDVYDVIDLHIDPENDELVICTWLISKNATQFAGSLSFVVEYTCMTDGVIDYSWRSAMYTSVKVLDSLNNSEVIVEQYSDVLWKWKRDLDESQIVDFTQTTKGVGSNAVNVWTITFASGATRTFEVRNGERGEPGLVGSIETITGHPLRFFVGTQAEYEALSEDVKGDNLFAIITDDPTKDELFTNIARLQELVTALQEADQQLKADLTDGSLVALKATSADYSTEAGHATTAGIAAVAESLRGGAAITAVTSTVELDTSGAKPTATITRRGLYEVKVLEDKVTGFTYSILMSVSDLSATNEEKVFISMNTESGVGDESILTLQWLTVTYVAGTLSAKYYHKNGDTTDGQNHATITEVRLIIPYAEEV